MWNQTCILKEEIMIKFEHKTNSSGKGKGKGRGKENLKMYG